MSFLDTTLLAKKVCPLQYSLFIHILLVLQLTDSSLTMESGESQPVGYLSGDARSPDEHRMGTSIMAVKFADGVIMGADSRTSTGSYVANRVSDKITSVHDKILCCRSGSAADTQAISDIVRYYLSLHSVHMDEPPLVKTAASMFADICYSNRENLMAGIICAGWDEKEQGSIYSIPLGGAIVKQKFAVAGSGSIYIMGYIDANYHDNMTKEEACQFVKQGSHSFEISFSLIFHIALSLAMSRDGSSGGVVRLAVITKDGVERVFHGDIDQF